MRFTPPANAAGHWLRRRALLALWMATRADEQAAMHVCRAPRMKIPCRSLVLCMCVCGFILSAFSFLLWKDDTEVVCLVHQSPASHIFRSETVHAAST